MQQVEDLALSRPLLDLESVAILLHVHYFLALDVQHMLAALEGCLELALLFEAFAKLPLRFVNDILLDANGVQLGIELAPIRVEDVCARTVVCQDLGLIDSLILGALLFDRVHLFGLFGVFHRNLFACRGRRLVVSASLSLPGGGFDGHIPRIAGRCVGSGLVG